MRVGPDAMNGSPILDTMIDPTNTVLVKGANVHVYPAPFKFQSRMLKITQSLADAAIFDRIVIVATTGEGLPEHERLDSRREVWRIDRKLFRGSAKTYAKALRTLEWSWRVLRSFRGVKVACINCHSLPVLPLCVALKALKGSKLVYDTHELETETVASRGIRKLVQKALERILIRFVDETIVVNNSIARWYQREYGLSRVWTVKNVPINSCAPVKQNRLLRDMLNLSDADILYLYLGGIFYSRGIPEILEAFSTMASDKHVVFIGYGELVALVQEYAVRCSNIHYHPAVPPDQIATYSSGADVGLSMIENTCLSYYLCLPNKLFEYMMSGLPVIVSDFPDMGAIVDEYGCGWKATLDVDSLRTLIQSIDRQDILAKRERAIAARNEFGWHLEEPELFQVYRQMFGADSEEVSRFAVTAGPARAPLDIGDTTAQGQERSNEVRGAEHVKKSHNKCLL